MNSMNTENNYPQDIEATEDELKGVAYTAASFIGVVTILIGSIIFFLI
jgi:hypothetical protein